MVPNAHAVAGRTRSSPRDRYFISRGARTARAPPGLVLSLTHALRCSVLLEYAASRALVESLVASIMFRADRASIRRLCIDADGCREVAFANHIAHSIGVDVCPTVTRPERT